MTTAEASVGETTVTQRLLATAAARGSRTALLVGAAWLHEAAGADPAASPEPAAAPDRPESPERAASPAGTAAPEPALPPERALPAGPALLPLAYPDLVVLLQRAAAGLAWRGVRPRDVVGVYVADAASYVLSCHAIRAAGAVPSPVAAGLSVAEIAGQLADCGARMLITSRSLAAAGLAAADRSWVRQVISFGEAPGAMPFASLLGLGSLQPAAVRAHDLSLLPYVRRVDGSLRQAGLTHLDMAGELARLRGADALTARDIVLAVPPGGDGRAYTALVDHALLSGATMLAADEGDLAAAAREHEASAAIVMFGAELALTPPLRMLVIDC
jgi:AMP-binding enzyme